MHRGSALIVTVFLLLLAGCASDRFARMTDTELQAELRKPSQQPTVICVGYEPTGGLIDGEPNAFMYRFASGETWTDRGKVAGTYSNSSAPWRAYREARTRLKKDLRFVLPLLDWNHSHKTSGTLNAIELLRFAGTTGQSWPDDVLARLDEVSRKHTDIRVRFLGAETLYFYYKSINAGIPPSMLEWMLNDPATAMQVSAMHSLYNPKIDNNADDLELLEQSLTQITPILIGALDNESTFVREAIDNHLRYLSAIRSKISSKRGVQELPPEIDWGRASADRREMVQSQWKDYWTGQLAEIESATR